jgi:pimeloyl-ACP methyl ester carboxylesterase
MSDDPVELVVEHDGLRIAALDWGGDGEPLLLLHPNGFCAGLFDPLARRLRDAYRPIGVDLRAHGGTDVPPDPANDYRFALMAADVLAVLDTLGVERVVALGESLGGGVAVLVDAARPGAIRRLLLCEAIAFGPEVIGAPKLATRRSGENFMATAARKRRAVWADRATVRTSYASRPPLDALEPAALDAYVRWGFVDRDDGQVELACPPEAEATIFEESSDERGAQAAWDHLADLRAPTVVLHGTSSNLRQAWFEAQAEQADAHAYAIEGGHLFLQEDSVRAEALVREHLA